MEMEKYLSLDGVGLDFTVSGASFIEKNRISRESRVKLSFHGKISKVILIWSGEVDASDAVYDTIGLEAPSGKKETVKADKKYEYPSSGRLYSCFADITEIFKEGGEYAVSGLVTMPVAGQDKDPVYTVGGYAIIVVVLDPGSTKDRKLDILSGITALRPGEMHDMVLLRRDRGGQKLNKIAFIGGHGRSGNASANLINGVSLSGGEDWDGSSGEYWDIDIFDFEKRLPTHIDTIITFDSVLQWIYPVSVICVYER